MSELHPLARSVPHPAPLRHLPPAWLTLFGLFGAPVAWSVQLLVTYGLVGDRCGVPTPTPALTSWIVDDIDGIAVLTCALALWAAWRVWRLTREEGPGRHHEALSAGHGRTRFLGLCGIVAGLTFLVASIFLFAVPFLVSPCTLSPA